MRLLTKYAPKSPSNSSFHTGTGWDAHNWGQSIGRVSINLALILISTHLFSFRCHLWAPLATLLIIPCTIHINPCRAPGMSLLTHKTAIHPCGQASETMEHHRATITHHPLPSPEQAAQECPSTTKASTRYRCPYTRLCVKLNNYLHK
jgi:hypothetical protein